MAKPWFRLYSEFVSDPKIQLLAFEDQRHFIAVLCLKCSEVLDSTTPTKSYRERMVAKALGLDVASATEAKRRLMEVGLIDSDWQPVRWDSRQYQSDSSTERVRKLRMKRSGNVSVTDKSRAEQIQSRAEQTQTRARDLEAFDADWLEANWPTTANNRNSSAAIHNCQALVNLRHRTWDQLRDNVLALRAYAEAGGFSDPGKVPGMGKYFRHDNPERYWERDWPLPKSKAQKAQDANVDAGLEWLGKASGVLR